MSISFNKYFMTLAEIAATKSKDSTQVGAVLISPNGSPILTAYNGPPRGVRDLPERRERPIKYMYASHAETNLVAFAAREGIRTDGCSVYVTHAPCASQGCVRTLIQAGITRIVYKQGEFALGSPYPADLELTQTMCAEAGVELVVYEDD